MIFVKYFFQKFGIINFKGSKQTSYKRDHIKNSD